MSNPKLAYRHRLQCPLQIPVTTCKSGQTLSETILWSVDNVSLATIDENGILLRNLAADTGTVTVTLNAYFVDPEMQLLGKLPDECYRPIVGTLSFDLVPLLELAPVKQITLKYASVSS